MYIQGSYPEDHCRHSAGSIQRDAKSGYEAGQAARVSSEERRVRLMSSSAAHRDSLHQSQPILLLFSHVCTYGTYAILQPA